MVPTKHTCLDSDGNRLANALCWACEEHEIEQQRHERIDDYNVYEEEQIALDNYYESLEMEADYESYSDFDSAYEENMYREAYENGME